MASALRFVILPKVAHPWFEEVLAGARAQAAILGRELGIDVVVEYMPPAIAGVAEQDTVLDRAAASGPTGIALDPVDQLSHLSSVRRIRERGIPLVLFDSPSPERGVTAIGNDFARQGTIAAERLVELIGHAGKVAVMKGFPTAPNHATRFEAQLAVLRRYPDVTIVDGGTDDDDIEKAHREARTVLEAHPDLAGYLCCDASGPIGIASAIREARRVGQVKVVGIDGIRPILEAIREGVIDAASATIPRMQGSMSVVMLWQASLGVRLPQTVDTGIDVITRENVDRHLAESA